MITRIRSTLQPPQCPSRNADVRCDRPSGHGGPHRHEYTDETGRDRIQSWFDRTAA